jgi:hypothetical protein
MNRQLNESLDRLVGLFASAREHERSEEPLRRWKDACRQIEAVSASKGKAPRLDRMGACLASMEGVVRCWADYGFECSYRLAGNLVETIRLVDC